MTRSTREQWEQRIRKWQRSGMDAASFAAREGLTPERLMWWRWHLGFGPRAKRSSRPPQFVEVVLAGVAEEKSAAPEGSELEVLVGKRRVLVRPGFDAQSLRQVLAVLEEN
jgi:hypothetical protein